ncbi:major facilitator superfamily domain-containing protein [Plectosphaerella cucumerina]|uniref:Major facilitator superfamily domain-containing protein n=1 Tax=Plectosphaerella cucumerina TaxID=40658 RepID=A0A8K0X1X8_9PEZI|nr:major facilitator superfamily domain-containing protein [Plectosphaerella cucumerina]
MSDHHHHHHDPLAGEIPVPHGPQGDNDHVHAPKDGSSTTDHERRIFSHITRPSDSYTPEGVYWADLPLRERISFVSAVDREEASREASSTWQMMKKDPLAPVGWYFRNAVLPGAGLGLEGYVLFSIGNLEPLYSAAWPECWGHARTVCSKNWIASVTYLEIVGIMIGQVGVGIIGDWIGRRWGLIQDALVMFVGLLLLTASWANTLQGWVIFYAWSLFFYGLGVGGEYPITATSSMESAVARDRQSTRDDRLHRGRRVTSAFLMQGWGQLANQIVLLILLVIFNRHAGPPGDPPYSVSAAQFTFRLSFALPAIGTLWLVYYRTWKMPRADRELARAKRRAGVSVTGYDFGALRACWSHFGGRLVATAGTWFCNDVFFYGNKLFQGQFIAVISSNPSSLTEKWLWNLANVIVSLAGYYLASFLIDNKLYGRKTMQQVGFLMCFIMFVIPAFGYDYFTSPGIGIRSFQAMYFLSSFFNQFGPNSVTFLVAGEVFPAPVRASAHGFSACIGKAGALLASVLYNYIDDRTKFHVVPWFGLAGVLLTWLFLPDTTGLDLEEQERRWIFLRRGEGEKYHGVAVHPRHLSAWERMRGVGKSYDQEADLRARIEEIRTAWEEKRSEKEGNAERGADEGADEEHPDITDEIHVYFQESYARRKEGGVLEDDGPGEPRELSEKSRT